jgi:uncharacterized protein YyaL (SSP411 family)
VPQPDANLLAGSTSPYLLQHAENPVHWRPWSSAALAEARDTGKPILLSVGYAACHWCHVMARESFEDPATAAVMNELFVNIKVDREERPDIDQIYMAALHAFGQQGGWPMTMFLDAEGGPFWGGTYFPKLPRWGRPAFIEVLLEVARIYKEEPQNVAGNAGSIRAHLSSLSTAGPGIHGRLGPDFLDAVFDRLVGLVDPRNGGTRGAPKFPQTNLLDLFWRAGPRSGRDDGPAATLLTLDRISRGGIWDHLGGGFARYSTDEIWLVPHFEKMLYDNAQLLEMLGRAWSATGLPLFRSRIEETVAWLCGEMSLPGGGFASSIDADSEHEEGRYYVWSEAEIRELLGARFALFAEAYDVTSSGNWEGRTILNRTADDRPWDRVRETRLAEDRATLLRRRETRVAPARDDKLLADWNGATIHALVLAARRLDRPDWLDRARGAYRFIAESMSVGDRLGHSWRDGRLLFPGLASDFAQMIRAALTLHETTREPGYLADALRWAEALERHHADPGGGWFLTADDAEALIVRMRSAKDDASPNHNAVAVEAFVRLAVFTGDERWLKRAEAAIDGLSGAMLSDVYSTAALSNALDTLVGLVEVVLVVPAGTDGEPLRRIVFESTDPRIVLFETESTAGLPSTHPAAHKPAIEGLPTAWVCAGGACGLPVTEPAALRTRLETGRPA